MKYVISKNDRFVIQRIDLLSYDESKFLDESDHVIGTGWWLGDAADKERGWVFYITKERTHGWATSELENGVRPVLRFNNDINARPGDLIEINDTLWKVMRASATSECAALCCRVVGYTRANERSVPFEFQTSELKSWLDNWVLENGLITEELKVGTQNGRMA
jgi:hypothetical protein